MAANPTAVLDAIAGGAALRGGLLVVDDVPQRCLLTGDVWGLDPDTGDIMPRGVFRALQGATVESDPQKGLYTIVTASGRFEMVSEDGAVNLVDPRPSPA